MEKERLFLRDWLCMARLEEIEQPGDYMTFRVMDEPIIIARDEAGRINAFANVCRHRGVEVASGSGNLKEFSCPYHGWTYDLEGRLIGAPYMKEAEGFDPAQCRLQPLKTDFWGGFIFVNFDPDAAPLASVIDDFDKAYALFQPGQCRLAFKVEVELDCNWKFAIENFTDQYHVAVIHTDTLAREYPSVDELAFKLHKRGGFSGHFDGALRNAAGQTLFEETGFGKMPWMADQRDSIACNGYMAPNMHIFAFADSVQPFVTWPVSVDKTIGIAYILFPEEVIARPDFEEKVGTYKRFATNVIEADRDMVRSLQRGMDSRLFDPGPMSIAEDTIHNAANYYLESLFGDLGPPSRPDVPARYDKPRTRRDLSQHGGARTT